MPSALSSQAMPSTELNLTQRGLMVASNPGQEGYLMSETPISEMSFEEAMRALEQVVGQLERGDVALEESITLYERGAELKKRCETKLKEAEEKVAAITLNRDGQPTGTTPVEGM